MPTDGELDFAHLEGFLLGLADILITSRLDTGETLCGETSFC